MHPSLSQTTTVDSETAATRQRNKVDRARATSALAGAGATTTAAAAGGLLNGDVRDDVFEFKYGLTVHIFMAHFGALPSKQSFLVLDVYHR